MESGEWTERTQIVAFDLVNPELYLRLRTLSSPRLMESLVLKSVEGERRMSITAVAPAVVFILT